MKVSFRTCAILVITTAVLEFATASEEKFLSNKPDFLTPCRSTDSYFNQCFAKNVQVIFHDWKDGIPGYKSFRSIDPLHIKRVVIDQDTKSPVNFNAELSNVVVTGVSNTIVKDARFNSKTLVSQIKLFLPKIRFDCDYKLNGRILNLALNGNGKAKFEIENSTMFVRNKLKLRHDYGHTFTDIEKLNFNIEDIGGVRVHFDNLFNGQKELEDSTNAVFNENWRDFYEILHPAISQAVQLIMHDHLSGAFAYVPADYFIEDLPSAAE